MFSLAHASTGRTGLDADLLAGEDRSGFGCKVELALHGDRLVGVDVGVGEVDLLLALVGDGHARGDDVELAAGLERRDQRVEPLAGNLTSRPISLAMRAIEVDVEALGDVTVHRLERRERRVRADGQDARRYELEIGGGCLRSWSAGVSVVLALQPASATTVATSARASRSPVILRAFCIIPPRRFRLDCALPLRATALSPTYDA